MNRKIEKILASTPTIEGAGVHMKRAFGYYDVPQLDPFLLLDDFRSNDPKDYIAGFPWHPHRGIETVTYMLEGRVEHGDSMGNKGVIGPGDVQWMTAGSGIIHQEMPKGSNLNAVVIMAKAPVPNEVKTRLIPPLEPEAASLLYHSFLLDKIEQVKSIEARRFVAYTPQTSESFFRSIIPPGFSLISQAGEDLGERLANVSKILFELGAEKVVMLDSDTPNLPTDRIQEALLRLDEVDVVLGPCEDGGYYLIGMRSWVPELFSGIPWSTSEVAELTFKKAQSLDLSVFLLDKWYDVDTVIDLKRLKKELDMQSRKSYFCENTCRTISFLHF